MEKFSVDNIHLHLGDAIDYYSNWEKPDVIISDGPYGVNGYEGDASSPSDLPKLYEEHIKKWSEMARPGATLWFWNTEIGWALVHPVLEKYGWKYNGTNIWDKGIGYIAGNSNSKTLSKFPIVTEVCVQYILEPRFIVNGEVVEEKVWLRHEWLRTGLPLYKTNEACNVKNAASRKYFTQCHLWYSPPPDQFEKLVEYANEHGEENGKPYFTLDGKNILDRSQWIKMHPYFNCPIGYTNVWNEPMVAGKERLKMKGEKKAAHSNQKPLELMKLIISASSAEMDVIWEPFGGLSTGMVAANILNRKGYSAELQGTFYELSKDRILNSMVLV
ncbi:DNA methyltransferase [Bacillus cereus group sp. BfR-BA-01511]|uniref:DNA methyltransferase n=1 Tax=Bacillus cereus group sp. BfR-BA-01511 TaxID=2920365 RepID=UPI001F55FAA3|nr:DNA methyltransferase [Bacillus cereus group sp. BfR-BA-01511]